MKVVLLVLVNGFMVAKFNKFSGFVNLLEIVGVCVCVYFKIAFK